MGERAQLATVDSMFRYPVKSMLGERLHQSEVTMSGLWGDRRWALRDEVRGAVGNAKKLGDLMRFSARYVDEPETARASAEVEIEAPDGDRFRSSDADVASRLSSALGHPVTLSPLAAVDDDSHYLRAAPDHADLDTELREVFARDPDQELPDMSRFTEEQLLNTTTPGSYFDADPLLLLSRQALARLADHRPESHFDVRRFRPNLLVDAPGAAELPEFDWVGKLLRVGSVSLRVTERCIRCVMVTRGFEELDADPGVMRAIVEVAQGDLGVLAEVVEPGVIREGDSVFLEPTS